MKQPPATGTRPMRSIPRDEATEGPHLSHYRICVSRALIEVASLALTNETANVDREHLAWRVAEVIDLAVELLDLADETTEMMERELKVGIWAQPPAEVAA